MTTIRFNPLTYANKLKEVGVNEKQAEVQAIELSNLLNSDLCTKTDLKELEFKMYSFILKAVTAPMVILTALQTLFHFIPK